MMKPITLLFTISLFFASNSLKGQDTIPSCVWGITSDGYTGLWEYLDNGMIFATGWRSNGTVWSPRHWAGLYNVSHDTVALFSHPDSTHFCGTDTGVYIFTLDTTYWRDTLIITPVSDPCTQRVDLVNSYSFLPCWSSPIAGLQENALSSLAIRVYPNPTSSIITIEKLQNEFDKNTQILLYNYTGKKLLNETTGKSAKTYTLDVGHLRDGIYFLQVVQDHQLLLTEKIFIYN